MRTSALSISALERVSHQAVSSLGEEIGRLNGWLGRSCTAAVGGITGVRALATTGLVPGHPCQNASQPAEAAYAREDQPGAHEGGKGDPIGMSEGGKRRAGEHNETDCDSHLSIERDRPFSTHDR